MNIDIKQLEEYPQNQQIMGVMEKTSYEGLREDIKNNGIKVDLHIIKKGAKYQVICGNQRLKIAKELQIKELPCKIINGIKEENILEYVIKDNLLRRHLSPEQRATLEYELYKLKEKKQGTRTDTLGHNAPKYDLYDQLAKDIGQSRGTIVRHIQFAKILEKEPEMRNKRLTVVIKTHNKAEEIKARSKITENLKNEFIYHGDAEKELDKVPNESIDCIIIDPPYNIGFKSYQSKEQDNFEDSIDMKKFETIIIKLVKKMKTESHLYCFAGFQSAHTFIEVINRHLKMHNILIWVKNNFTPADYRYYYAHQYEMILYYSKGNRNLNNVDITKYEGKTINLVKESQIGRSSDILMFDNDINKKHSCQKPVKLLRYLIANSTVKGETVLDCFAGSGTTIEASIKEGRNFIAIEKDKDFYNMILEKIGGTK